MARSNAALLIIAALAMGCQSAAPDAEAMPESSASATAATSAAAPQPDDDALSWQRCRERIAEAKKAPALPGAPKFEEQRVHMARVRGTALLWRRPPAPAHDAIVEARSSNDNYKDLVTAVRRVVQKTKPRERRREVLLREGYLFSEDVETALALVEQTSLTDLFDDETIYLQRGVDILELKFAERTRFEKDRYLYVDGIYAGQRAEILHGDRVAKTRQELEDTPPLVVDLQDVTERGAFDRLRPVHFSEGALVADLRYGGDAWVPALLAVKGVALEVACEALDEALAAKKAAFVDQQRTRRIAMKRVRAVVREMVRDEIPFDADRDQTNGFLRKAWKRAYFKGWRKFTYEGKLREVYTEDGHPRPPQVCIDFLTDVWERASGTWYQSATRPEDGKRLEARPKRTEGAIDFDKLEVGNRRSVASFTDFTIEHPEYFDVWEIPRDKRIAFRERDAFFAYLAEQADMFIEGDMITIHGYKEGGRPHYHSLMVLEKDPITGVPTLVGGNAVFAREQTLEGVMHISPQRSLRHRIRVTSTWLDTIRKLEESGAPL